MEIELSLEKWALQSFYKLLIQRSTSDPSDRVVRICLQYALQAVRNPSIDNSYLIGSRGAFLGLLEAPATLPDRGVEEQILHLLISQL